MHCARYCGKPSGSYPLPDAADDIFTNGGSRVDLHDFSSKIAEATRNLSPAERESLRKIFEGVSAEILQESAHALSSSGTPAACAHGNGIPDGPTERHKLLKENFLKQVPSISIHRARVITQIDKENPGLPKIELLW